MDTIFRIIERKLNRLKPTQVMVSGFALLILIGTILLSSPMATSGENIGFIDALFTSTSAVCVTGLIIVDTSTYWSTFGQLVIITLIQIGGLGFMTITTLFAIIMKKKINLKERLLIQESLNQVDLSGLVKLTRHIIVMTFAIEGIGAILLSTQFIPEFGLITGIWYSIFHSISAFCNAGFDLMGSTHGAFSSLSFYVNSFTVSVTLSLLIILGGLGFPTIFNIIKEKKFSKFSLHTKIVILTTLILILFGTSFLFLVEYKNPDTIGNLTLKGKLLSSAFQSITARTAGFNTIDLSLMNEASIFVMIILMFIGASPASTGGGIKTTTLAVLLLSTKSFLLGKHDVEIFKKRIDFIIVKKALGIFLIALFLVISGTLFISIIEPNFTLLEIGFEVVSALTTAGLSICGTANLNALSKIILITYMFIGRVGSMTVFIAFLKHKKNTQSIKYPEGKIIVG